MAKALPLYLALSIMQRDRQAVDLFEEKRLDDKNRQ